MGCPSSTIGMSTMKELLKHRKDVHAIIQENDEDEFPKETEIARPKRPKPVFTGAMKDYNTLKAPKAKRFNLDSHMITHSGKRDFLCNVCDMSLARENDRVRHEATYQEKQFECGGFLNNDQPWGYHQKFARADTLESHHNTITGQACIQTYLQQQQQSLYEQTGGSSEEQQQII
ncbi:hypothetical protein PG985_002552 [Apiospora marii]|uniref:C2H2-type domain-containing protein n=1 Tax=Apiospora marii TaxID=335849 RepID=A0ABR1RT73_9PEZI